MVVCVCLVLTIAQEPGKMYLVLEYCGGGDLGQYLRRYSRMSEDIARYFLLQLAEGMKEMRVHNLIHVSAVSVSQVRRTQQGRHPGSCVVPQRRSVCVNMKQTLLRTCRFTFLSLHIMADCCCCSTGLSNVFGSATIFKHVLLNPVRQ